jgi:diguanylate cyclase (GGDEF)-like protein
MALTYMTREELQSLLTQLEQALHNHIQWHNGLIRIFICRLPPDLHDTKPKAYRECLFGQWYYNDAPKKLQQHTGFIAIGEAHRYMHNIVAQLLLTARAGRPIEPHDYDSFANAMERLRLEIASLRHEVEISLYTHDPLTGAINRSDMLPSLRELHEMVQREPQVCSLAMVDLDFFKKINDEFGHPTGDKVLASIAHYIAENLRPYDKLFRYGGEEFLICMQKTAVEDCYGRIEAIREGISRLPHDLGRREASYITVSCGVSSLAPEATVEQCIDRADKALYSAKTSGRNCTRVFDPLINQESSFDVPPII